MNKIGSIITYIDYGYIKFDIKPIMKKRKLALITLLAVVSMMSIGINAYAENTDSSISQEASDSEASATESVSDAPMQVQLILKDNKN